MGYCDILTDISEHVTLLQLMDNLVNMNNAISVVGYWIFDSNYKTALVLKRKNLDMICALSVGEKQVAVFDTVFTKVSVHFLNNGLKKV